MSAIKKSTKLLVLSSFAFALCFALIGCGSAAKKTDFVWYKAAIPESYEADTFFGDNCYEVRFENKADHSFIDVDWSRLDVDKVVENYEESNSEDLGEMELGNYTWKAHSYFNSDGTKSTRYFMGNSDGTSIMVHTYKLTPDDKPAQSFMESLEFDDNPSEAWREAEEAPVPEIQR